MTADGYCPYGVPGKGGTDRLQTHDWRLHQMNDIYESNPPLTIAFNIIGRRELWYCTRCRLVDTIEVSFVSSDTDANV